MVQAQLRLGDALARSPRVKTQQQTAAKLTAPVQGIVQRKLVVGDVDYTERYNNAMTEADKVVVLNEVVDQLRIALSAEPQLAAAAVQNQEAIRKQIKKWVEDLPGYRGPTEGTKPHSRSHLLYGRKEQNRRYANWTDLARGLLGWVEAKEIRKGEGEVAEGIYRDQTLSVLLDSLVNKLYRRIQTLKPYIEDLKMRGQVRPEVDVDLTVDAIYRELTTGISILDNTVKGGKIGHYREYYEGIADREGRAELRSGVPENRFEILSRPENYSIKAKISLLHDLMEYFGTKRDWNPKVVGEGLVSPETEEESMITTAVDPTGRRSAAVSAKQATPELGDKARGKGLTSSTRDEDAESTKLARQLNLPVWASQSLTAVRMLHLAKWSGADVAELSALAHNLFAFWRLEYDHRAPLAYHTLHEVMDMAQNFGVTYIMPTEKLRQKSDVSKITTYRLQTFKQALEHADKRYVEMVGITRTVAARLGDHYAGPNVAPIRETFNMIREADQELRAPYQELKTRLERNTKTEQENANLLRQVFFLLNKGMMLQEHLYRLIPPA